MFYRIWSGVQPARKPAGVKRPCWRACALLCEIGPVTIPPSRRQRAACHRCVVCPPCRRIAWEPVREDDLMNDARQAR